MKKLCCSAGNVYKTAAIVDEWSVLLKNLEFQVYFRAPDYMWTGH